MAIEIFDEPGGATVFKNTLSGRRFRAPTIADYSRARREASRAESSSDSLAPFELPQTTPRQRVASLTPRTNATHAVAPAQVSDPEPYVAVGVSEATRRRQQAEYDRWQQRQIEKSERLERQSRELAQEERLEAMQTELATLRKQSEPPTRTVADEATIERYADFDRRRAEALAKRDDRSLPVAERRKAFDAYLRTFDEENGIQATSPESNESNQNGETDNV
jgi:hypothetical protein